MGTMTDKALETLRHLNQQVRDGKLDKREAAKLAIAALEEVKPAEQTAAEPAAPVAPAPEPAAEEPAAKPEPAASVGDPKAAIIGKMAEYQRATDNAWLSLKQAVTTILKGTSGEAFPVGDLKLDASDVKGGVKLKLTIQKADRPNAVEVALQMSRAFDIGGITAPEPIEAAAEPTCHLNLRKEIITIADHVVEASADELSWARYRVPMENIKQISVTAAKERDTRVLDIMSSRPVEPRERQEWRRWALAAQVYLLGVDFADQKAFAAVRDEIVEA